MRGDAGGRRPLLLLRRRSAAGRPALRSRRRQAAAGGGVRRLGRGRPDAHRRDRSGGFAEPRRDLGHRPLPHLGAGACGAARRRRPHHGPRHRPGGVLGPRRHVRAGDLAGDQHAGHRRRPAPLPEDPLPAGGRPRAPRPQAVPRDACLRSGRDPRDDGHSQLESWTAAWLPAPATPGDPSAGTRIPTATPRDPIARAWWARSDGRPRLVAS